MAVVVRFGKAFGRFWYEFIVGDDWKIAVAVVLSLAITLGLYLAGLAERAVTVIGAALVLASFSLVLAIDLRSDRRRR
jgi:hypothetical protein